MEIPEYFIRKASRQFGDVGPDWVRRLPSLLARCQEQWRLTDSVPADHLSINLVCYAQSETHGDVVLKIQGPHSERYTEMIALRLYEGRRACKCLETDEEVAAMLLERIVPGHDLKTLPSKRAQLEIGAELIAGLPISVKERYGLPRYEDWVNTAIATTHARYNPDSRMISLMVEADAFFRIICPADAPQVLLHGDLHHENILQHRDGEWKAIDPQGVIGAPVLETARFIQNHAIDDEGISWETLDETVAYLGVRLGQTRRTIAGAVFLLHVLSTCWGYEMNYDKEQINQQIDECEGLLAYVRSV